MNQSSKGKRVQQNKTKGNQKRQAAQITGEGDVTMNYRNQEGKHGTVIKKKSPTIGKEDPSGDVRNGRMKFI